MTAPFPAAALAPEIDTPLILALPKGRILQECAPLLARAGDPARRRTSWTRTAAACASRPMTRRSTWSASARSTSRPSSPSARAHVGICGADVLMEFDYPEIYAPLDLGIGQCRVSVAEPAETAGLDDPAAGRACGSQPNTPTSPAAISPAAACRRRSCT